MTLRELEELARVEHRRALHPRVERIRRNRVELLVRRLQIVPRVVEVHARLRVLDDVEVVLGEVGGDDARHERLDLRDRELLHSRIDRGRARRHAGAAADDEHVLRVLRDERRHVAEHPLQPHVLRLARRLDLAGVVIVQHAAREPRHGNRGIPSFAPVDDVGLADPRHRVSAVRDEQRRNGRHVSRQQRGTHGSRDDRDGAGELRSRPSVLSRGHRLQNQKRREPGDDDENLLGALAAKPRDQDQARRQRADDRADRVRGVDPLTRRAGILTVGSHGGERQREAGAPQDRRRQHGPHRADEIELEVEPGIRSQATD